MSRSSRNYGRRNRDLHSRIWGLAPRHAWLGRGLIASIALHLFIIMPFLAVWREDTLKETAVFSVSIVAGEQASTQMRARAERKTFDRMVPTVGIEKKPEGIEKKPVELGIGKAQNLTPTATATPTPTFTPRYTATTIFTPTRVATPTSTARPTNTAVPSARPTIEPTATRLPTATSTLRPTRSVQVPTATVSLAPTELVEVRPTVQSPKPTAIVNPTPTVFRAVEKQVPVDSELEDSGETSGVTSPKSAYDDAVGKYLGSESGAAPGSTGAVDALGVGTDGGSGGEQRPLAYFTYMRVLQEQLRSAWTWHTRHTSLKAEIEMRIARDGTILFARIAKSSGNAEFDRAVMRSVKAVDPFPAPPEEVYDYYQHVLFIFDPEG